MINLDIINLIANTCALTVAGILYVAYIKNLRSQVSLKNDQVQVADQNAKLWKDKAMELERKTPEYMEKVLADRIRIREEEIRRLKQNEEEHQIEIEQQEETVQQLKIELAAANYWLRFREKSDEGSNERKKADDLDFVDLGEIWVDSAVLMICDPMYLKGEEHEYTGTSDLLYKDLETGEIFYAHMTSDKVQVPHIDGELTIDELVRTGRLERLPTPTEFPANPETYIRTDRITYPVQSGLHQRLTFYNGVTGAGIALGTGGDGRFRVYGETYEGKLERVYIDL